MAAAPPPDAAAATATPRRKRSLGEVLSALRRPKVATMFVLGFSSGLPFMLVGNTFNYWLGDAKVDLAVVGFASWVGLAFSFQFVLAGVVDNVPLPLLSRLGRRRGWMLLAQLAIGAGLAVMAANAPQRALAITVAGAVLAAVGAATQDCAMNAWRIEIADDPAELDLLTSAYSLGYRLVLILTGSVILFMAQGFGWPASYAAFAGLTVVGMAATFAAREPVRADAVLEAKAQAGFSLARVVDAVVGPFVAFFDKLGWAAFLVLGMVTTYHLCDYLRGPVINPFYTQVGLQKPLVATVRLAIGIPASLLGITAGGLFAARFGRFAALATGGVLQPLAVAAFALLAATGPDPRVFGAIMAFDDFAMSFAGVVLIAYISTLTSLGYTATQYALLVSALNFSGKTLKGFSGVWVKGLATSGRDLTHAYAAYFGYAALVGIPALAMVAWLAVVQRRRERVLNALAPMEAGSEAPSIPSTP